MEGVVVFGGWDGDVGVVAGGGGRVVVMRCGGPVVGCDGSGLLGGGPRGAVSTGELGEGGDFLHVLDVARAFVAALDWGGEREAGVKVVQLGFRGKGCRDKDTAGAEGLVEKLMEGSGVYVPRGGPAWWPKKSVARRAVRLWKFVSRR